MTLISFLQDFLSDYGMVWVGDPSSDELDMYIDEPIDMPVAQDMWKPGI